MSDPINIKFRLPEEMHVYLTAWAKRERRSLHSLVLWILDGAIDKDEQLSAMKRRLSHD
jgi:predicted HicB family RNase H-like nuclease